MSQITVANWENKYVSDLKEARSERLEWINDTSGKGFQTAIENIKDENKDLKRQIAKLKKEKKMLRMHRQAGGETIMICRMEDSHLHNTIMLFIKQLREAKGLLDNEFKVSPLKAALYGLKTEAVKEKSEKAIRRVSDKLYPYLAESMLRGTNSYSTELQEVFERTGREDLEINIDSDLVCLPEPESVDPDLED